TFFDAASFFDGGGEPASVNAGSDAGFSGGGPAGPPPGQLTGFATNATRRASRGTVASGSFTCASDAESRRFTALHVADEGDAPGSARSSRSPWNPASPS